MASPASIPRLTAIVTGAARGIGKAIVLRLIEAGYSVCISDVASSTAEIDALVAEINSKHTSPDAPARPRAIGIAANVTSSAEVEAMIKETVAQLGPLTLMVANAGVAQIKPLLNVTEEDVDEVFNSAAGVNVYKIVGAASVVACKAWATLGIYSASKWAVRGLTQAMAMEMAPHKITVNAYAPGVIGTAMWEQIDDAMGQLTGKPKGATFKQTENLISLGRTGTPEDVSGLVGGYLASKDSDYVTGQTMVVDGGIIFT
ncbi:hypothetical protein DTO271D3_5803 [Paecilomyces variotii]|nr:hypothetical protein DTO169E5_4360 [Paecilomyces variotii]KAJ9313915.1 hypothetical protein DTO271D3_5803 [Paecilomyces variotii]